jgi:S-disulfanyl-L-cysteine oxidoreductase SoxD
MVRIRRAGELKPRMRLVGIVAGLAVLAALGIAILALWPNSRTAAGLFRPGDGGVVRLGAGLYQTHCAACHGAELEGETPDWQIRDEDGYLPAPPHDETGHTWHHPDQILFDITKYGIAEAASLSDYATRMPAFEGVLEDEEIIAILSFIKSRWPDRNRQYQDEMNRRFQERSQSVE